MHKLGVYVLFIFISLSALGSNSKSEIPEQVIKPKTAQNLWVSDMAVVSSEEFTETAPAPWNPEDTAREQKRIKRVKILRGIFLFIFLSIVLLISVPVGYGLFRLFKHLFAFGSAETKYRGVKVMPENKKNNLEGKQHELVKQIAHLQKENPELMDEDTITGELSRAFSNTSLRSSYDGYFAESGKRFALKQVSKTNQARQAALNQVIGLCQRLAEVNRSLAALSESEYERVIAVEKRRLREERIKSGKVRETVQKEMDIEDLELDYRKAQIETKLQAEITEREKLKKVPDAEKTKEQKNASPHEKFIQSTTDKMEMLKAKSKSLDMAKKTRDEDLLNINQQEDPELYNQVKNMWDNFIMELMK